MDFLSHYYRIANGRHISPSLPFLHRLSRPIPLTEWKAILKLKLSATSRSSLLVEELLSAEWIAILVWVSLSTFMTIWVIAPIKPCLQLRIAEDLVCFVYRRHPLLRIFFCDPIAYSLIWVMLSSLPPVSRFDLKFVCILGHTKNLIIILLFTTLQCYLGSLEFGLDLLITRMVLICKIEGTDARLIVFFVTRLLGLRKKPIK